MRKIGKYYVKACEDNSVKGEMVQTLCEAPTHEIHVKIHHITLFNKCAGSLTTPTNHVTQKMQETRPKVEL